MPDETAKGSRKVDACRLKKSLRSIEENLAALRKKFPNPEPAVRAHLAGMEQALQRMKKAARAAV